VHYRVSEMRTFPCWQLLQVHVGPQLQTSPHRHEAVGEVDAPKGTPEGRIMEEVHVGYTMHGRVIRPAMVKVARSTNADNTERREDEEGQEESNNG